MTVIAFTTKIIPEGTTRMTRTKRRLPGDLRRELAFGGLVAGTVLGLAMFAAFNGGMSLTTGDLELRFQGSLAQGLQITFASVSS